MTRRSTAIEPSYTASRMVVNGPRADIGRISADCGFASAGVAFTEVVPSECQTTVVPAAATDSTNNKEIDRARRMRNYRGPSNRVAMLSDRHRPLRARRRILGDSCQLDRTCVTRSTPQRVGETLDVASRRGVHLGHRAAEDAVAGMAGSVDSAAHHADTRIEQLAEVQ